MTQNPKKILIEVTHPAHVHFFRNPIRMLGEAGHDVLVTSRDKDCTLELLDRYGIEHQCISKQNPGGFTGMAGELAARNYALWRIARKFRPGILTGIGGIWAAQVGWLLRRPSVIFYDTETARLQNALTYPFATRIVVPDCYRGKLPEHKTARYSGYHELSYLHPDYFRPDKEIALANGLASNGDTFLIRLVSWQASHDVGLHGWTTETLLQVVESLGKHGKVIISAEATLPDELSGLRYTGLSSEIHHLLAFCRLYVGESATMASEAVIMGVPAIYAAPDFRGYVSHQDKRYGMACFIPKRTAKKITSACDEMMKLDREEISQRHQRLISECVDVNHMIVELLSGQDQKMINLSEQD